MLQITRRFYVPEELIRTILGIGYFVLDCILFVPATLVLWNMRKGDIGSTHWILISLFIIFNAIGNIGFGYSAIIGTVGDEEWIWDIFFNAGYLTLVCALFWQNKYLGFNLQQILTMTSTLFHEWSTRKNFY